MPDLNESQCCDTANGRALDNSHGQWSETMVNDDVDLSSQQVSNQQFFIKLDDFLHNRTKGIWIEKLTSLAHRHDDDICMYKSISLNLARES